MIREDVIVVAIPLWSKLYIHDIKYETSFSFFLLLTLACLFLFILFSHVCWWNNEVLKPIQTHGNIGEGRAAMGKLRKLLDKMMLRRTKIECADDLGLPPRVVTVRRDVFNEEEEDVYTSLYSDTARQFTTYVEEGSVLNNYANIFELLTRMRLCANHPDLVTKKKDMTGNKQLVCMLCSEPPEVIYIFYSWYTKYMLPINVD